MLIIEGGIGKHASPPCTTIAKNAKQISPRIVRKLSCVEPQPNPLATKDLRKPHSSRWVGGAESQRYTERLREVKRCGNMEGVEGRGDGNEQSHIHMWWVINERGTLGARDASPSPNHPAQGSSTRRISPPNFWL